MDICQSKYHSLLSKPDQQDGLKLGLNSLCMVKEFQLYLMLMNPFMLMTFTDFKGFCYSNCFRGTK